MKMPDGAGRYDHADPDEGTVDIEPFMAEALERVIEVIMDFGQYPKPRKGAWNPSPGPKQFDLYDFLEPQDKGIEFGDLLEYLILSITNAMDYGPFPDKRRHWEKIIEKALREHLRGSAIVQDRAAELAREAKEDA